VSKVHELDDGSSVAVLMHVTSKNVPSAVNGTQHAATPATNNVATNNVAGSQVTKASGRRPAPNVLLSQPTVDPLALLSSIEDDRSRIFAEVAQRLNHNIHLRHFLQGSIIFNTLWEVKPSDSQPVRLQPNTRKSAIYGADRPNFHKEAYQIEIVHHAEFEAETSRCRLSSTNR
jgi:hypothetical protein